MDIPDDFLKQFDGCSFSQPCSELELNAAEQKLGESFPDELRRYYFMFDGFIGPTNASFLWPLVKLIQNNRFLRDEPIFPSNLISQCLFFGDEGIGAQWGYHRAHPGKIICWNASWGEDFEFVGDSILEVWLESKRMYDELAMGES